MIAQSIIARSWLLLLLACSCSGQMGWPDGTYGLPMPSSGCPNEVDWKKGYRQQETEEGSHASTGTHLSQAADQQSNIILQKFCMKLQRDSFTPGPTHHFQPGKYCILKSPTQNCPAKFDSGWIYWDDAAPFVQKTIQHYAVQPYFDDVTVKRMNSRNERWCSRAMPDGMFDRNTRISYCCRRDGSPIAPIKLPNDRPFFLLRYGDICQQVEGMMATEEWLHWSGEKSLNLDSAGGIHPAMERTRGGPSTVFTRLHYCFYAQGSMDPAATPGPSSASNLWQTLLLIVYVICTIVGLALVVAVALATVQRLLLCRAEQRRRLRRANQSTMADSLPGRSSMEEGLFEDGCGGSVSGAESSAANTRNKILEASRPPSYDDVAGAGGPLIERGERSGGGVEGDEAPPSYDYVLEQRSMDGAM